MSSEDEMSGDETKAEHQSRVRAERIARARQFLADAYAADPAAVQRINARMARIDAARKRERQRFDHLVLGNPRPPAEIPPKPPGMSRQEWKAERKRLAAAGAALDPEIEAAMAIREMWSHKPNGTAQTHEHASRTHSDALAQLHANGTINKEQLEWTAQIANVYRSIEAGVGVKVASLEARVDMTSRPAEIAERIHRVRMHKAYGIWRDMLPMPKALVLDMIVGDAIGYTVAARRHRVHKRKAKRLLLEAIGWWPVCVAHAFSMIDEATVNAMNEARAPGSLGPLHPAGLKRPQIVVHAQSYEAARKDEQGREETDEPYLLPPVDPVFLDDDGYLRSWAEIADIVRARNYEGIEQIEAAS